MVESGFSCGTGVEVDPLFGELRDATEFGALRERAEAVRAAALDAFDQERGDRVLGGWRGPGRLGTLNASYAPEAPTPPAPRPP